MRRARMKRKEITAKFILILLLVASQTYAVLIATFPGLEELVRQSDAIVILRVDKNITAFGSPTLYSTHDCFIYQTLKGNIPTGKVVRLRLMDTRSSFVPPYSIYSTHLMFLTKKRSVDEPTEYRTIEIIGANVALTSFGHERMPEGKTVEDQIRSVLRRTLESNQQEFQKEENFLNMMIKGSAAPRRSAR
jgi:hypothetical protein